MIPFLDLAADFAEVEHDARARLDGVLARQQFVLGPETAELEASLASMLGAPSAVAVSSGTDALSLALLALGVGPGSAVLMPAFTFFATAGAVVRAGATPVFCDIDRATFLAGADEMRAAVDRDFAREGGAVFHRASGARLAALMPVHLYGRAVGMDAVVALARELGVKVIEDAAQALLARTPSPDAPAWVSAGLAGDAGCVSFYPTKNLGGPGDGGLVLARDAALGARIARLRTHGSAAGAYTHDEVGVNARMGETVAAVLNAKLARLVAWTARRRAVARLYHDALEGAERRGLLERPPLPAVEESSVWHQYAVRVPGAGRRRDAAHHRAAALGVATRVFYPLPLHLQPALAALGGREGQLPVTEATCREVLCLPVYPSLGDADVARVAAVVVESVEARS